MFSKNYGNDRVSIRVLHFYITVCRKFRFHLRIHGLELETKRCISEIRVFFLSDLKMESTRSFEQILQEGKLNRLVNSLIVAHLRDNNLSQESYPNLQ